MKVWVVATANNINTDIDLSVLFTSKEETREQLVRDYKDAVERYFGCEVTDDLREKLEEEDEANISDFGFSVYHSHSQNLEFGQICEIEIPDPAPSRVSALADANLKADDMRSRSRAFAQCLDEMASTDTYADRGCGMLQAIRNNDLNAFVYALTGWNIEEVMQKAHLCRDTDKMFSQEPVYGVFTYHSDGGIVYAPCKVDLCNHRVFDISPDVVPCKDGNGLECGDTIQDPRARVHIGGYSFYCVPKEEMEQSGSEIVFWYGKKEETDNG